MGGGGHHSTVYAGSGGDIFSSIANECGCPGLVGLETLLRTLLSGNLAPAQQPRPGSLRRDWNVVVCFSCDKAGYSATCCPTLDESFPFMLPGWMAEKVVMWIVSGCRRLLGRPC